MSNLVLCAFADEASSEITEQVQALKDNGIGYIEVRGINGKNVSQLTEKEAKEFYSVYSDAGIKVWSIGSPIGKININDDFDKELEKFKRTVQTAEIMQASCIRIFSFYGTEGKKEYSDAVLERLSKYVDAAKGSNVVLCHENEKGIYGELAPQCLEILKALPQIKCVFDAANFIQASQDVKEAWDMLKGYVYYHHIKDALPNGDIVPAGYGVAGIKDYLKEYSAMGGGVLTIEPHLAGFVGIENLANDDERKHMGRFSFASCEEAFGFAADSLKKIISEI